MTKNPSPPKHHWVSTQDGSYTLFSEAFQEACHSNSGAIEETKLHYLQGCRVEEKLHDQEQVSILEVGFGLGIGFLTTYETLQKIKKPWHFVSLEIDEDLLEWFRLENINHPFLKNLKWINSQNQKILAAKDEFIDLQILCGNARSTLPQFLEKHFLTWDCIYQDAFSPKKNPILWAREWFSLLRLHSNPEVILSTYSSSTSIRKSLLEAGWFLHKGEAFGPKRSSTRASLLGPSDPDILLHLERSPVSALRDDNLDLFLSK